MRILIGADHGGYLLKESLKAHLAAQGHEIEDVGTHSADATDYPDVALKVARGVAKGEAERGILICGTGIGMAIVANKVPGVRAANITDPRVVRLAREHNDANVLTLAGRFTPPEDAAEIADAFLAAAFTGDERHVRRIGRISEIDDARQGL
ncbi:MAG: ribose 5-phosphate isomerase B [Coriobacteriaceae bacterium]|nr:ribose 5-phosphate isomerase B [Coriobacteriaceae bacterium]